MSVGRIGKLAALACISMLVAMVLGAGSASAAGVINLCIGSKAGQGVKSGGEGTGKCPLPTEKLTYDKVALPKEESEQQALLSILSHAKYIESGVGGKPTIQFSGVNVQVVSGAGKTNAAINGEGNLVIGYDENGGSHAQIGSHDLILGEEQTFTSYGGLLAGFRNSITGPFASVTGGLKNTASAELASVSGGDGNTASGLSGAWAGGGLYNTASGELSSVAGGGYSTASGERGATVVGGAENRATGNYAVVSGGDFNLAEGTGSSVSGGIENSAGSVESSVSGGSHNHTAQPGIRSWIGGGYKNTTLGNYVSIFGGKELTAKNEYEAIP